MRSVTKVFGVLATVVGLMAAPAFAEPAKTTTAPPPPPLTCADFQHNADGSWTPLHAVTIGGVTMGPGVAFREGVSFGGLDLAAALNKQCVPH